MELSVKYGVLTNRSGELHPETDHTCGKAAGAGVRAQEKK